MDQENCESVTPLCTYIYMYLFVFCAMPCAMTTQQVLPHRCVVDAFPSSVQQALLLEGKTHFLTLFRLCFHIVSFFFCILPFFYFFFLLVLFIIDAVGYNCTKSSHSFAASTLQLSAKIKVTFFLLLFSCQVPFFPCFASRFFFFTDCCFVAVSATRVTSGKLVTIYVRYISLFFLAWQRKKKKRKKEKQTIRFAHCAACVFAFIINWARFFFYLSTNAEL